MEKGICLFELFPLEVVPLIVDSRAVAEKIIKGTQKISVEYLKSKSGLIDDKETARGFIQLLDEHEREIVVKPMMFARYLLNEKVAYFTLFCLYDYIENERNESVDFRMAVHLFLL